MRLRSIARERIVFQANRLWLVHRRTNFMLFFRIWSDPIRSDPIRSDPIWSDQLLPILLLLLTILMLMLPTQNNKNSAIKIFGARQQTFMLIIFLLILSILCCCCWSNIPKSMAWFVHILVTHDLRLELSGERFNQSEEKEFFLSFHWLCNQITTTTTTSVCLCACVSQQRSLAQHNASYFIPDHHPEGLRCS